MARSVDECVVRHASPLPLVLVWAIATGAGFVIGWLAAMVVAGVREWGR